MSLRVMTRINGAVVLSSSGLSAMTLLATPQRAIAADEMVEQIDSWLALQRAAPYGPNIVLPTLSAEELVAVRSERRRVGKECSHAACYTGAACCFKNKN